MVIERENFVNGNASENVPGCASKGISPEIANGIYDSMMDFAKYAFNKSHAACYAVVAIQTAWLKYYYPVEFMAALMTSVIDNPGKVSGYIMTCRNMNIPLLPPDINEGFDGFSVTEIDASESDKPLPGAVVTSAPGKKKAIRYALTAIKGIGRPVIASIVKERAYHGKFKNINDFLTRMQGRENDVNKRAVENFIKSGAFDCFEGTRKQLMTMYSQIMDQLHSSGRNTMAGQMTLFDFASEDQKKQYEIPLPNVGEFPRELMLEFEKEVLGIYVSGHPLEEYEGIWKKKITNTTTDFYINDEGDEPAAPIVKDKANAVIGGIIAEKKIKYTKNDQVMAFITLEDMVGSVEVIVFPKAYEANAPRLNEDAKVFIEGRVSVEEDKDAKLIASKVLLFDEVPKTVWLRFANLEEYQAKWDAVGKVINASDGNDNVNIFLTDTRQLKKLGRAFNIRADHATLEALEGLIGKENVQVN